VKGNRPGTFSNQTRLDSGLPLSFECDHVVLLCWIRDWDENRAAHQYEISCEAEKKNSNRMFPTVMITLCHACEFLNGTNGSWKVGRKWKMANVQDAFQH
jgi:hypothetical protein